MARGSVAKEQITKKILETFDGAFIVDGKEIRIPVTEGGDLVQIKVTLTAAKVNIDAATPSQATSTASNATPAAAQITADEKAAVVSLVEKLGL